MLVSTTRRPVVEVLVEEALAEPAAGIGQQRIDRPAAGGGIELVDAFRRREIGLHRIDLPRRSSAQPGSRLLDLRLVGGDQQVEAVLARILGEFEADAGGSAGDDGKLRWFLSHGSLLRDRLVVQGFITTLMQPSFLSRNVL